MKKLLFIALVVAYIATAFGLDNGFEMNLIPFNWDIYLLVKFLIVFILTAVIESYFIKKKIWKLETHLVLIKVVGKMM